MLNPQNSPGGFERLLSRIADGALLRLVFAAVAGLTIAMVTRDFLNLRERQAQLDPGLTTTQPVRLAPPTPGDHIRPYLPRTQPIGPDRDRPQMPGLGTPVDPELLAQDAGFYLSDSGRMSFIGRIDTDSFDRLKAFLETNDQIKEIYLHSPGGSVYAALGISQLIRDLKINTVVPKDGYCASACPLIFAGGVERFAADNAWIGVHRAISLDAAFDDFNSGMTEAQALAAQCQRLLNDMGVAAEVWIHAMETPAESLYVFTTAELEKYKLKTDTLQAS